MASIQQCSICFDDLAERLTAAPCGHVFHTECITPWHESGGNCPMCKTDMPRKLLRLFFEPRQAPAGSIVGSTQSNSNSPAESEAGGEKGTAENQAVSAEVTELRRQLVSSRKVIAARQEALASNASEMAELRDCLSRVRAAAAMAESTHDAAIKAAEAKLQTTSIELCRKHTEVNRLKREMEGVSERLRQLQGDKVAHAYLSQFGVQDAGARSLNGLGQVKVETVLEQVAQGGVSADSIIRAQHDFLSGGMDREQKTKRKLRESKVECETTALKLETARAKLLKASKEIHRLRKALADPKTEQGAGGTPKSSGRSPMGRTDGQQLSRDGGGRSRESSRPAVGVGASLPRAGDGKKRPAPSVGGARGVGALGLGGGEPSAKRRSAAVRDAEEGEDGGMVSLGSDDGGSDSDAENKGDKHQQGRRAERSTFPTGSRGLMGRESLLTPAMTPFSFFPGAAGRGRAKGQPAQFIGRGYNATGGTHNVRKSATNKPSFAGK